MIENNLLNVQEVADILKIARNTVYELIKRGELNTSKVGKQMRVSRADVEDYLQSTKLSSSVNRNAKSEQPLPSNSVQNPPMNDDMLRGNELIICGQDISLDILVSSLNAKYESIPIYRSHMGSYNGVYALYQGKVNVATAHLWDGDEDSYNVSYVKKMMPGVPAVIVRIGQRREGFYVEEGNPHSITGWADLLRPGITIANREKGSGVRVLLDEKLRLMGVNGEQIQGYQTEQKTHLAVATQVASGRAMVGIGSERGCQAVAGLAFIPLQTECYDLILRKADATKPQFSAILEIMQSEEYRHDIKYAAGFDVSQTGKVIL